MRQQFLTLDQRINWWTSKGPWVPWILCKQIFISMARCTGSKLPEGEDRTRLYLNPAILHVSPSALQTSRSVLTTTSLQFYDASDISPLLKLQSTQPSLHDHTEQAYPFCSFILCNLITNSWRQEACLMDSPLPPKCLVKWNSQSKLLLNKYIWPR